MKNKTIMQYFEWYYPANCTLWHNLKEDAAHLSQIGITDVWLPPAYKGDSGVNDVGYGVYDMYDLGEFSQKGSVPTKYGTKDQYLDAINELHHQNIKVLADIVFNHRMGADETEEVIAQETSETNREEDVSENITIQAWTKFTFPGRNQKYSDFTWNWTHFHGVDWDESRKKKGIFLFYGKHWDKEVDSENVNYDYLMGADVDLNNVDVVEELANWTRWYLETTNIDGFRLDAVKHIRADFYANSLAAARAISKKELFTVGEYWKNDVGCLGNYLEEVNKEMSLFDVPLHYNFYNASHGNGNFNLGGLLDNTLVKAYPNNAVTFVENHDTQTGQSLQSPVEEWFKPLAYAIILLRNTGIPCVFYGDYYGVNHEGANGPLKDQIDPMLKARADYCYGELHDYFDHQDLIGWTLEGDDEHENSGLAVVMTDHDHGSKHMEIGKHLAGCVMYDITGNVAEEITVGEDGYGDFCCNGGSVSVWVRKEG